MGLAARVKFNHLCKLGNRRIFLRVMLYKTFGAGAGPFTLDDDSPAPSRTERRTTCQKTRPKIDVTGGKRERSDKVAVEREAESRQNERERKREGRYTRTYRQSAHDSARPAASSGQAEDA